ncbi:hypothetical protein, partial [Leifsonia shinshuensis]|uniref:hypothetical protein n=1 Tax=Leifsonia shinshuensis TaxID=150026 RepID=UPI0035E6616C
PISGGAQQRDRVHEQVALNPNTRGAQRSEYSLETIRLAGAEVSRPATQIDVDLAAQLASIVGMRERLSAPAPARKAPLTSWPPSGVE